MANKFNVPPEAEAAIREDERFRMAVFTQDAAAAMHGLRTDTEQQRYVRDLTASLFAAHAEDILDRGARFSANFDRLPEQLNALMGRLRDSVMEQVAANNLAQEAMQPVQMQLPLDGPRDIDPSDVAQDNGRGQVFEIQVTKEGGPDDDGNNGDPGTYLN